MYPESVFVHNEYYNCARLRRSHVRGSIRLRLCGLTKYIDALYSVKQKKMPRIKSRCAVGLVILIVGMFVMGYKFMAARKYAALSTKMHQSKAH